MANSVESAEVFSVEQIKELVRLTNRGCPDPDSDDWHCPCCHGTGNAVTIKQDPWIILNCGHAYHQVCMTNWLRKGRLVCPLDNVEITYCHGIEYFLQFMSDDVDDSFSVEIKI